MQESFASEYERLLEEERVMDATLETFELHQRRLNRLRELHRELNGPDSDFDAEFYNHG